MFNAHVRPSRDLRTNYADVIRELKEHNQIIITNRGKGEAVLIDIEDYAEYEDFLHRRYVKEKLAEAELEAKNPDAWISMDELWDSWDEWDAERA